MRIIRNDPTRPASSLLVEVVSPRVPRPAQDAASVRGGRSRPCTARDSPFAFEARSVVRHTGSPPRPTSLAVAPLDVVIITGVPRPAQDAASVRGGRSRPCTARDSPFAFRNSLRRHTHRIPATADFAGRGTRVIVLNHHAFRSITMSPGKRSPLYQRADDQRQSIGLFTRPRATGLLCM